MWCNNRWNSCGCGRTWRVGSGFNSGSGCGCGCVRNFDCGCDQEEEDDFSLERVGSLPLFISIPTWLTNGQGSGCSGGCGCG